MVLFVNMATAYPQAFVDHLQKFISLAETQPALLNSITQLLAAVGKLNKVRSLQLY